MDRKLKIAMISLHSCPMSRLGGQDTGGMNVYIRELAAELGKRGHQVDIFTRSHRPGHEETVTPFRNTRLVHLDIGVNEEISKIACYPYIDRFARQIEDFSKACGIHYDILHSHYWLSGLIGKQLKEKWNIPHISMFHTLAAMKNRTGIGAEEPELRLAGERQIAMDCDRIVAATREEQDGLITYYGAEDKRIAVIPCGVNLSLFRRLDGSSVRRGLGTNGRKLLLYVGRIEPIKGLECLLKALSYFDESESPMLMVIGGDIRNRSGMRVFKELAESCHTLERVYFIGSMTQDKLPLYYSAADACVIPSYYESCGIVALEAMACGTPVIATNVGIMSRIITSPHSGVIIKDNMPLTLMQEIRSFLSNGYTAATAADRRAAVAGYSWNTITDRILQQYITTLSAYGK